MSDRPARSALRAIVVIALAIAAITVGVDVLALRAACAPRGRVTPRHAEFFTLGELAQDMANDPAAFNAVIDRLGGGRTAVGSLSEESRALLRALFAARDYAGLDRQPRTTLPALKLALDVLAGRRGPPPPAEARTLAATRREDLGIPTGAAPPPAESLLRDLGVGLLYGDRIDPDKALRFRDSERLAALLDALSLNPPGRPAALEVRVGGASAATPEDLVRALERIGHRIGVRDERFAANFGDLERDGRAVATPLWVETGRTSPDGSPLAIPVPHAQVSVHVRGPTVNADATLYNSLDIPGEGGGGTRFRADLTRDAPWVGGRIAHVYDGDRAVEAVRWMGRLRRAAQDKLVAHRLPLDGYYAIGVCTLAPAVVEQALTGRTTLWPLTHDPALFAGDDPLEALVRVLPVDGRGGPPPDDERLLGSIPWSEPGRIPFPELAAAIAHLSAAGGGPDAP